MSIEAMKMALEVLETTWGNGHEDTLRQWEEAITALRQAIEQAEKREWVGLTTSEVIECQESSIYDTYINIEAKLKEKDGFINAA